MEPKPTFRKLARQGYRAFRHRRVLEATILGLSVMIPVLVLAIGAGILFRFQPVSGWIVPLLGLGAVVAGLTIAFRYGMQYRFTYPQFLRHLERRLALSRNELINADELEAGLVGMSDPLSRGLAAQAVGEGRSRLDSVSFGTLSKLRNLRAPAWRALAGAGSLLLLALLVPDGFRASLDRLLAPGSFELPPAVQITVLPGNVTVPRGASVSVAATAPQSSEPAQLLWRPQGGGWRSVDMRPTGPADEHGTERQAYQFTLAGLSEDLEYAVASGRNRSEGYRIAVTEPLRAQSFKKTITPPTYTGLAVTEETALDGNLAAVVGSRVTLTVNSSREGARGQLVFEEGDPLPLQSNGGGALLGDLTVRESMRYRVELIDPALPGIDYTSSIYRIDASPDRLPTLYQLSPESSIQLPPEMTVQLDVDCLDDFGLTRLDLLFRRNEKPAQRANLATWQGEREARVVYPWDLEGVAIAPGDVIRYHLELTDNDAVSGPKTVRGPECEVRFPKLEEMYAEVQKDRDEQESDVAEMMDSQKQLKEELDKALQDIKANKDLSWEKQEALKDLAERQEKLTQKLEDLSRSLDQSLEQMQQAELFSPEMLEKVKQISELVKQIQDPAFQKQIEELKRALEKLDKNSVEQSLEQMQMSQKELEQSLERTLELLQKMKTEEHLDQLVQDTRRLLEQQEKLNRDLEEAEKTPPGDRPEDASPPDAARDEPQSASDAEEQEPASEKEPASSESEESASEQEQAASEQEETPSDQDPSASDQEQAEQDPSGDQESPLDDKAAAELQKRQEELKEQLEKLQEELAKLEEEAKEHWEQLEQEMQENESQEKLESAKKNMADAAQKMSGQQKKQSLQFGRKAESDLQQFAMEMEQMQQDLQEQEQEDITRELFAISGNLVSLSQSQEQLLLDAPGRAAGEMAERQSNIAEGGKSTLDDLYELGKKSQFLSPELSRSMSMAVQSLKGSTRAFEQGNRQGAMAQGHASTNTMNETVIELLETNSEMCSSASSGSCNNPMGKMRSLSAQQEKLNGESQSMLGKSPRLSQSQSEQQRLEGLAAQQEMIRRGLEDVEGALEGRKDVLGRLGELGEEMEELAEEMRERGEVDERILERQQKILSRLLTAQKSIRREDFDDERVARTGVNPDDREAPPTLTRELSRDDLLRRGILRGSQDPVPDEFRSLVEDYFQSLSEKSR